MGKVIKVKSDFFFLQKPQECERKQNACQGEHTRGKGGIWHGLSKVIKIFSLLFNVVHNSLPGKANQ